MSGARLPQALLLSITFVTAMALLPSTGFAQQTYVTRYDAFVGFNLLNSPSINLTEPGFGLQFGFRPKTWYSFGVDYTRSTGDLSLTPDLLTTDLQQRLAAQLKQAAAAGLLPAGYRLTVPARSVTHTIAVGPQLAYRHFRQGTIFFRPLYAGAIHESATPHSTDPIAAAIVKQLAPSGTKTATTWFLGFGGGFDILAGRHFAFRAQADIVWDHLFNDLLQNGRWTTRFSVGPAFNFGKNIARN